MPCGVCNFVVTYPYQDVVRSVFAWVRLSPSVAESVHWGSHSRRDWICSASVTHCQSSALSWLVLAMILHVRNVTHRHYLTRRQLANMVGKEAGTSRITERNASSVAGGAKKKYYRSIPDRASVL